MNSYYIPKPWHYLLPAAFFALGTVFLRLTDRYWSAYGWVLYGIAIAVFFVISWAIIWDVFIRKADSIRYLFDSARYLDHQRTSDLLIAMGLKPLPSQPKTTTVTVNNTERGVTTSIKIYHDIPASPVQLEKLALGLLLEGAPFSRREWTGELEREKVFTQTEFNRLAEYCDRRKLRAPAQNSNTFEPTQDFKDFLQGYLPSPTPLAETA